MFLLDYIKQFRPLIRVLAIVLDRWVEGDLSVLCANVHVVVDLPVDLADLSGGVEQTLDHILKNGRWTQSYRQPVNRIHDRIDDMGGRLKDVGPNKVQQVEQRILAAEANNAQ